MRFGSAPVVIPAIRFDSDLLAPIDGFTGRVFGVYRDAIYLGGSSGNVVVLTTACAPLVPCGIELAISADLGKVGAQEGDAVIGQGFLLSVPASGLTIDVHLARTWPSRLPSWADFTLGRDSARRLDVARDLAAGLAPSDGLGPFLRRPTSQVRRGETRSDGLYAAMTQRIAKLRKAESRADLPGAVAAATSLVGLGVGLTPSGDDFLVGLLAGLQAGHHPMRRGIADGILGSVAGRTTQVSQHFLQCAGLGHFSESIHKLLRAVARGPIGAVHASVDRILGSGATSGFDLLVGIVDGLEMTTQLGPTVIAPTRPTPWS